MNAKTWDQYHADILILAEKSANYKPDIICPVMLGGLIPGAIIAKYFELNDVRPIDIERNGDHRRLAYDVQGNISGKRILIVEDDLPTGIGPARIAQEFRQRGSDVKIGALYVTPQSQKLTDFWVELYESADEFPGYPWKRPHIGDRVIRNATVKTVIE